MDILKDFPEGPLDEYRRKASFNWKLLKICIETEEVVKFKDEFLNILKSNPIYKPSSKSETLDEKRHNSIKKMFNFMHLPATNFHSDYQKGKTKAAFEYLYMLDSGTTMRLSVHYGLFLNIIQSQGTDRHYDIMNTIIETNRLGCFCMTEIGHGSNTRAIKTKATYDKASKQFVLNTPNFEAAKCWAGLLGKTASYAIVYAQLYTSHEVCHGIHSFLIRIRDDQMNNLPGVIAGDLGEKIGLNSLDNGFMIFNNFRVAREALLNKIADVTEDGIYVTPIKDPSKRFGTNLGALSFPRITIISVCEFYLTKGVSIAIRYAAVRKQFGPKEYIEIPILEYQTHQHRLLPYLASVYVFKLLTCYLYDEQYKFTVDLICGEKNERLAEYGLEIHAIASSAKPVASWMARDGLQECREACGGHGYLKIAEIGDIRSDNESNITYEGENHVLIQQTSNVLLKYWAMVLQGKTISSPMKSFNFLSHANDILSRKFTANTIEEISKPEYLIEMYQWLVCYLTKITYIKYGKLIQMGKGLFGAKNESQVFYARNLGIAYIQQFTLSTVLNNIHTTEDPACKIVLTKMLSLYGLFTIEKLALHLYQGGFFIGEKPTVLLHDAILKICYDLKDDAVALVDVIAPPDFIMKSVLGKSDGKVYEHLEEELLKSGSTDRPLWWEDIVNWQSNVVAKL